MIRKCALEIVTLLDEAIFQKGFVGTPNELLIRAAQVCAEKKPDPDLFRSAFGTPHGESWCVEFLQTLISCVEQRLSVDSPLPLTVGAMDLWNRSKNYQASLPKPGSIVVWQHTGSWQGHAGLYIGPASIDADHWFETVEGNTHAQGDDVTHDGDGVYSRLRLKGGTVSFKMVGFLNAF